jgi:hypothetical protein
METALTYTRRYALFTPCVLAQNASASDQSGGWNHEGPRAEAAGILAVVLIPIHPSPPALKTMKKESGIPQRLPVEFTEADHRQVPECRKRAPAKHPSSLLAVSVRRHLPY